MSANFYFQSPVFTMCTTLLIKWHSAIIIWLYLSNMSYLFSKPTSIYDKNLVSNMTLSIQGTMHPSRPPHRSIGDSHQQEHYVKLRDKKITLACFKPSIRIGEGLTYLFWDGRFYFWYLRNWEKIEIVVIIEIISMIWENFCLEICENHYFIFGIWDSLFHMNVDWK